MVFASRTTLTPSVSISLPTMIQPGRHLPPRGPYAGDNHKTLHAFLGGGKAFSSGCSAAMADTLSAVRPTTKNGIHVFVITFRNSSGGWLPSFVCR